MSTSRGANGRKDQLIDNSFPDFSQKITDNVRFLGAKIRAARHAKGLSIKQLSGGTGISSAMISLVERGLSAPSFGTIVAISIELETSLSDLFSGDPGRVSSHYETAESKRVVEVGPGIRRIVVLENFAQGFTISQDEWFPDSKTEPLLARHQGFEVGYVLEGELSVDIEDESYILKPGDTAAFPSVKLHRAHNTSAGVTRALWFNFYNR
jgi:transcriptional regulator with XRE-family HTH domain